MAPGVQVEQAERSLVRFSQLIQLGIAIGFIWFSIGTIAFNDEATNADFAVIFFAGMLSAILAIGWVELQSRGNDHQVRDVHDYMLGVGFFFAAIGTVWGSRFVIGLIAGSGSGVFGATDTLDGWSPNQNAIYVQTAAILGLMAVQYRILNRFKGETKFGWAVASYAPMIVLIGAGMAIWLEWSGGVVSYGIGISLIVLSIASMEMALRSNNSINLIVIVIASGLAPLLFEAAHDVEPAQAGGALSLLVFIIAIQGYYASKEELRSDIMQKASLLLIAEIIIALLYARGGDLNLILGPVTSDNIGAVSDMFSLSAVIWLAVFAFYFPAMLQQRLPWIPIGLAFSLMIIPTQESTIPWLVTIAILPYLLLISKVTRKWVANATLAMTAVSFIVVDLVAQANDVAQIETYGTFGLHILIPIALVTVSELALRKSKIDMQIHMMVIGCIALSRAVLFAEEWYTPWFFVTYLLYLARRGFDEISDEATLEERWKVTLSALLANAVMIALVAFGRLDVPESMVFGGYRLQVFAIGALSYALLRSGRTKEFDLGMILNWTGSVVSGAPRYDPETNTWKSSVPDKEESSEWNAGNSWSPLARSSLVIPFIMMTAGIFIANGIDSEEQIRQFVEMPIGILLLAIPIACLVWEILALETITSKARSSAVWILFTMGLGPALFINALRSELGEIEKYQDTFLLPAAILLDLILMAAPLIVAWVIGKRGIDRDGISPSADAAAMVGLLALACLDTTGGLLMLPMLALAMFQSVRYRHSIPLMLAPLVLILTQNVWLDFQGLGWKIVQTFDQFDLAERSWVFGLSRMSSAVIVAQMAYILVSQMKKDHPLGTKPLPWIGAWIWMAVGLIGMAPDLDWFQWMPLVFTLGLMINGWLNGQVQYIPLLNLAQFVSVIIALSSTDIASDPLDLFSLSALITGATALLFSAMHENGILYSNLKDVTEDSNTMFIKLPSTDEQQEELNGQFELIGYLGLAGSLTILWGVGTFAGALLLTRKVITDGRFQMLVALPLVHSLALFNMARQIDAIPETTRIPLVGVLLIAEGIAFAVASIKNDAIYDYPSFDWPNDDAFFEFMDQIGIVGIASTVIGIFMVLSNFEETTLAFALTSVVLVGVGIQGYSPGFEARWRRLIGGYGSIVSIAITSSTLDGLPSQLGYMFTGIVAIGWIFMSSSMLGDSNEIYTGEAAIAQAAATVESGSVASQPSPQPGTSEEKQVAYPVTPMQPVVAAAVATPTKAVATEVAQRATLSIPAPVLKATMPRVKTRHGFEIELPPNMFENILASIDMTPHEGYKPVVSFGPRGEINLNFEES
jgi:hypothetical protein